MDLGEKLKELRLQRGLTQTEVAKRIWVSKAVISGYELSSRAPSYVNLVKLAALYGVTTDYLLGVDSQKTIDVTGLSNRQITLINELVSEMKKNSGQNENNN